MRAPPLCRLAGPLAALLLGCGPATSPAQPPAPSSRPPPVVIESDPGGAPAQPEPSEPLIRLVLVKAFSRMVDCGHDQAVGDLRCTFTAAGKDQPVRDIHVLRPYLTEPPGLILAAADWHPAHKLSEDPTAGQSNLDASHEALLAECRIERRGELTDVRLAATTGVPGWLYATTVPVAVVSDCAFAPHEGFPKVMSAAHLLVMHNDSRRKPAGINRTRSEALTMARDVAAQLADGMDFGEVTGRVSDEPGAERRRGDLGRFKPSSMVPEFIFALLATPIGERTPIFETTFGFHIAERRPPDKRRGK